MLVEYSGGGGINSSCETKLDSGEKVWYNSSWVPTTTKEEKYTVLDTLFYVNDKPVNPL